jgi:hypothetical protein
MNNHVAFFVGVLVDVHLDGLATIQMSIVKIQKKNVYSDDTTVAKYQTAVYRLLKQHATHGESYRHYLKVDDAALQRTLFI